MDTMESIKGQIKQEAALQNARQLIDRINNHCFDKCVPRPGNSLSGGEQTCFTQCMEKYMSTWNTVSKQYVARIQQQSVSGSSSGGMF